MQVSDKRNVTNLGTSYLRANKQCCTQEKKHTFSWHSAVDNCAALVVSVSSVTHNNRGERMSDLLSARISQRQNIKYQKSTRSRARGLRCLSYLVSPTIQSYDAITTYLQWYFSPKKIVLCHIMSKQHLLVNNEIYSKTLMHWVIPNNEGHLKQYTK